MDDLAVKSITTDQVVSSGGDSQAQNVGEAASHNDHPNIPSKSVTKKQNDLVLMVFCETIFGAALGVFFDRLASQQVLTFFWFSKLDESLFSRLKHLMEKAGKLLADAEQEQFAEDNVQSWPTDLRHLFYQAEDIADEIATEDLRSSLDLPPEPESFFTKVRNCIPAFTSSSSFANSVNSKMREIVPQLDEMVNGPHIPELRGGYVNTPFRNKESTSYIPREDEHVFGRDQEKENLLKFFSSKEARTNKVDVVAIVGMAGIGKTTLAKLVYNDHSLTSFPLKVWVYVSDQFNISRVTKSILQGITGESYPDSLPLQNLCSELRGKLKRKRFFLVLDDLWNRNYEDWKSLLDHLTVGAHGSKIIVTTRDGDVASMMGAVPVIRLYPLLDEDSWSLFRKHAFEVGNMDCDASIKRSFRGDIVDKCGGHPLAIKTLGGLLRSKESSKEWRAIIKSPLLNLSADESNVTGTLLLSYHHLPSHLKRCFSYCAVFPKGYEFDRKTLVLMWMAENFVQPADTGRRIEDVGEDYFSQLLSRSFFDKLGKYFVMHDLWHDLAQAKSGKFFARLEHGETAAKIPETARYFSYLQDDYDVFTKFEGLLASKYLRTIIPWQSPDTNYYRHVCHLSSKVYAEMIPKLHCLRVLSLSNDEGLKLPDSIAHLKQLRYLDVSGSGIKELPESVSSLCNLQTLLLSSCVRLKRLPAGMSRLVSLRHLDISKTRSLVQMPKHMSKLKSLQTLSGFVVSKHCDQGIEELGELQHIRGKLALRSLQNVSSPGDALQADLSCREHVNDVALEFDEKDCNDSEKGKDVVENLKPHANLERLTIRNYPGTEFPSWLHTQCSMYKSIVDICLSGCKHCSVLPPLGQLPCLKSLEIVGMEYIVTIGPDFYAYDSTNKNPFSALHSLVLEEMKNWREWSGHEREDGLAFSRLEKLRLQNCPEFEGHLPANLASLKDLVIHGCGRLERPLTAPTSISMEGSWQPALFHLTQLELIYVKQLVSLPPQLNLLPSLETLTLGGLEKLESLETVTFPTKLGHLAIWSCEILKCMPKVMLLENLQNIMITYCPCVEWNQEDILPTSLQSLTVDICESLEYPIPILIERMQSYSSLDYLKIAESGSRLVSFPLGAFPKLRHLELYNLESLETVYIPSGTDLINLTSLQVLGIKDCPNLKWIGETEEDGAVDLPTPNLVQLVILWCDIVKPLTGGSARGLPSKLQILETSDFNEVSNPRSLLMFSCLRTLEIRGYGEEYFPDNNVSLPTTISHLSLRHFPNLKNLNGEAIKTLTSLRILYILECPNLQCLPDEGLPSSLGRLAIIKCPLLENRWKINEGPDSSKINHIPCVTINHYHINHYEI